MVPFLGSALGFGFNPGRFVTASAELRFRNPFGVALPGGSSLYFLQGAENIVTLWKKSTLVPGTRIHLFFLKHLFGMPEEAIEVYALDNSGIKAQPLPGSNVSPHHRIHHLTHTSMLKFMGGAGLAKWYERWASIFLKNLQSLDLGEDWVEMPDLMDFVSEHFGSAVLESMCGPTLRKINPNFMQDLKDYHYGQPKRSKCIPEWMMPQAYAIRRKILSNIKEWHATARKKTKDNNIIQDKDFDSWWGSDFMKDRQGVFEGIKEFDYEAYASSDLGLIWTANTNIVPSTMWMILETFKNPITLARVRNELETSFSNDDAVLQMKFDSQTTQALPLLKSVYAETLRLRIHVYAVRYTGNEELQINNWVLPKEKVVLVATGPSHMDKTFWNTKNGLHPVDQFWADRFLVYGNDPQSGPHKHVAPPVSSQATQDEAKMPTARAAKEEEAPEYTIAGTEGMWIPYGGGTRSCPGRFYSKHVMIATCAMMVTMFDMEILAGDDALRMNPLFYGFGGQHPIGKVPFRIRKKRGVVSEQ
ncbi:MAG: hypothetical protein Q9187_001355 [Circinaria calcarea]